MLRLIRGLLLVASGLLLITGTFVPWVSWNNLAGKAGGRWTVELRHIHDPRIYMTGARATGEFDVLVTNFNKEGQSTQQFSLVSPKPNDTAFLLLLVVGALACLAAFRRSRVFVSFTALSVAVCGLHPLKSLRPFLLRTAE